MIGRIGMCSWSVRPAAPTDLAHAARACGIHWVQLALDPLRAGGWSVPQTRESLAAADAAILSGMMACKGEDYATLESIEQTGGVRPDSTWADNLDAARGNARIAQDLGLRLVTFHAGFIPGDRANPERHVLLERIRAVVAEFAAVGIDVALETGQETADTVADVLNELALPTLGVNFDPANMILYGKGEPIAAMRTLAPWIRQVHIKDALPTRTPGTWGEEVRAGTGAVDWRAFLDLVRSLDRPVDLVIEREAGEDRIADIRAAKDMLARLGVA